MRFFSRIWQIITDRLPEDMRHEYPHRHGLLGDVMSTREAQRLRHVRSPWLEPDQGIREERQSWKDEQERKWRGTD